MYNLGIDDYRPPELPFDYEFTAGNMTQQPETMTIPCVGTNNVDLLRIPIHFKAANTLTLVDTGSVASLLAERVFRKISEVCTKEETTFSSFVSAGGHPIEICGCFRIPTHH